jgi:hypothetical protein
MGSIMQFELGTKTRRKIHPESLLQIPLVKQLLSDPIATLSPRALDQNWYYQKAMANPVMGFSPFQGQVFFASESRFADWLENPFASARDTNTNDELVREVLFAVHDYLHIWAYRLIQELQPGLGFGTAPIQKNNWEKFIFCHLLTEAVSVVGLDYWFLSTVNLNSIAPIGTKFRGLTVDYHEADRGEYARFNPDFNPQQSSFLGSLARFYCDGEFVGFDLQDFKRSPILMHWLRHELMYGAKQREYTRAWFRFLSDDPRMNDADTSARPVACDQGWQKRLMREVGEQLWLKIKENKLHRFATKAPPGWQAPLHKPLDFRFLNLNTFDEEEAWARAEEISLPQLCDQWLARQYFESFECDLAPLLPELIRQKDGKVFRAALRGLKPLPRIKGETREIFVMP